MEPTPLVLIGWTNGTYTFGTDRVDLGVVHAFVRVKLILFDGTYTFGTDRVDQWNLHLW